VSVVWKRFYTIKTSCIMIEGSCLCWCRDRTDLLQHAQRVADVPDFNDLAIGITVNDDPRRRDLFPGRRHALHFALIGALHRVARHHSVSLGNLMLNRNAQVRKGRTVEGDKSWYPHLLIPAW